MIARKRKRRLIISLLFSLFLLACLPACGSTSASLGWHYADLKYLDPPETELPSQDLTAVYLRQVGDRLEFRLELIEVPFTSTNNLYLLLDTQPGGQTNWPAILQPTESTPPVAWDYLLRIGSQGDYDALTPDLKPVDRLALRIDRNPTLATIDIGFDLHRIASSISQLHFQVAITPAGNKKIVDSTPPISSQDSPPPKSNVLLAFFDNMPASTPAQALRSWDGAHSGPFGERHGMHSLFQLIQKYELPIILMDIKTPESLAALDYINGMPLLKELTNRHLAILPQTALPGLYEDSTQILNQYMADSLLAGDQYQLPPSPIAYLAIADQTKSRIDIPQDYTPIIMNLAAGGVETDYPVLVPQRLEQHTFLDMPVPSNTQIDRQGLSLKSRQQLVMTALSTKGRAEIGIYVLGGSLSRSAWGDFDASAQAMEYLHVRPWIDFLSQAELLGLHPQKSGLNSESTVSGVETELLSIPKDPMTLAENSPLSWSTYRAFAFQSSNAPTTYQQLVGSALWIPDLLQVAEDWARQPYRTNDCSQDLDQDGQTECLLTSDNVLAVIDPYQTGLTLLGVRQTCHPVSFSECSQFLELVGPSSQLALGLSDASTWNMSRGPFADPAAVPGGFVPSNPFAITRLPAGSLFVNGQPNLIFSLLSDGLQISAEFSDSVSAQAYQTRLPVVLDPLRRFSPGWQTRYSLDPITGGFRIFWMDGPTLEITSSGMITANSFAQSPAAQLQQENPDLELPPGHFYPFPLTVLNFTMKQNTVISIRLTSLSELGQP